MIPAPTDWISANQRLHWAHKAARTKIWRDATNVWARRDKLPKGLDHVHVTAWLSFTTTRRRDPANFHPTVKAIVDGLVDYGLIVDDDAKHLTGPVLYLADPATVPIGSVRLEIREVAGV